MTVGHCLVLLLIAGAVGCRHDRDVLYAPLVSDAGPLDGASALDGAADADVDSGPQRVACGGLLAPNAACASCIEAQCCDEAAACAAEPDCMALRRCRAECGGDLECRSACSGRVPSSAATIEKADLDHCENARCSDSCPVGGDQGLRCDTCMAKSCPDALPTSSTIETLHFAACINECAPYKTPLPEQPQEACGCDASYSAGQAAYDAGQACYAGACIYACWDVPDWSCVGQVEWPAPPLERRSVDVDLQLAHRVTFGPIADAVVKACALADADCEKPLGDPQTTDARGRARLTIPRRAWQEGFVDYLLTRDPSGDTYDTLSMLFPPIVRDESSVLWIAPRDFTDDAVRSLGLAVDPARGLIGVALFSCSYRTAPGIEIAISPSPPDVVYAYNVAGSALLDATLTQTQPARPHFAVVANVPPGIYTLEARRASTAELVSRVQVRVRANASTYLELPPTPLD